MQEKNRSFYILIPVIIAFAIILGMFIEKVLNINNHDNHFFIYPKTNKLNTILNYIEEEYVDSVSKEYLIENAIPEIIKNLDPHSVYIPADLLQRVNEPIEGNFEGVGIQFNIQKDTIIVVKTIHGGPSHLVGILDGDRIVKINDSIVAGINISNEMVMKLLRGEKGTKVNVSIARRSLTELIDFTITRNKIPLYSVDVAYMLNKEIAYIKISKFSKTTYNEFIKAINDLKNKGLKKIIIDIRGNTGGIMDAATKIADEFLEKNKIIVFTQGRARQKSVIYSTSKGICKNNELVILIDEWSASASEILAGAIQDNDRGLIIGRRSFGKGLVQEPTMFSDGSALRLTIARYYTPTGRCIQKSYNMGNEVYNNDINDRYLNGEFSKKDSIHFPDSLKYITQKGRVVYGGGGIMPDIFVPFDTIGTSEYLNQITRKGLEYQFAFEYTDKYREILSKYNNSKQLEKYLDTEIAVIFNNFIDFAEKNGVKKNINDIKISKKIIKTHLKALIARNIFDNEGFYPIVKDIDTTLKIAEDALNKNNTNFFD
ncbi:MAG: S41 family peptidase [Bacteroidales bacterium]|nr:S41 family peptidase [Bacteroidales bacterium]